MIIVEADLSVLSGVSNKVGTVGYSASRDSIDEFKFESVKCLALGQPHPKPRIICIREQCILFSFEDIEESIVVSIVATDELSSPHVLP
mmetsp:Transcript_15117/g.18390  ORF Transcript_15117/g.18390 Transcript_15117/m.18390 type:complete len:89 (+) Transcript_15117:255-521(+)